MTQKKTNAKVCADRATTVQRLRLAARLFRRRDEGPRESQKNLVYLGACSAHPHRARRQGGGQKIQVNPKIYLGACCAVYLHAAGGAEAVADHRLGAVHRDAAELLVREDVAQRLHLCYVTHQRARRVAVHVVDLARRR
jgi:hypothetical protein